MTERNIFTSSNQIEAGLTKKTMPRTLKSEVAFPRYFRRDTQIVHMEEGEEDIRRLSKKIKDITYERQRRGVSADETTAAKVVWQTVLGRNLNATEAKATSERGAPVEAGREPTKEDVDTIGKIVRDPKKFENVISSVSKFGPVELSGAFTGDMGKIMVAILGEGVVTEGDYIKRLDEIVASRSPQMHQDIVSVVKAIENEVEEKKKKDEEEERRRGDVNTLQNLRAKKAWEVFLEKKRQKGEKISPALAKRAERAMSNGIFPDEALEIGGGALGDDNFVHFNMDDYENPVLREVALFLHEAGEENRVDENLLVQVEGRLRAAVARKEITNEEYEGFKNMLNQKKAARQTIREGAMEVPRTTERAPSQQKSQELTDQLFGMIDGVLENMEPEQFNRLKTMITSDDKLQAISEFKGASEDQQKEFWRRWQELQNIDDPASFKQAARNLVNEVNAFKAEKTTEEEPPKNEAEARERARKKGLSINSVFQQGVDRGWFDPNLLRTEPQNVIDLAKWIMITDDARVWGPNADYPLFKVISDAVPLLAEDGVPIRRDERGNHVKSPEGTPVFKEQAELEFQPENFVIWLRNKMLELHADNSTDPVNFLGQVAIRTLYSPVSLISMKYDKQRYFSDPKTGEIMDDLYNEVILEGWLFGVRRNNDLQYFFSMPSDDKLFEKIVEINSKNEHTNAQNAADYYSMADKFVRGYDEDGKEREKDTKVGDGILLANQIYRNLPDFDKLKQILPEDNPFFKSDGWRNAVRMIQEKGIWEKVTEQGGLRFAQDSEKILFVDPKTKEEQVIFDENGKIVENNFVRFVNFFTSPTVLPTNINVVRELVKLAVADEIGFANGLNYPPSKEEWEKEKDEAKNERKAVSIKQRRDNKRINLNFIETNSFVEQRWNGAEARADTGVRGYDAWTKMFAQRYRERQSGTETMGPIGNPKDIPILKQLAPDMWLALRTENGEVAQEVFEKIITILPQLYKNADPQQKKELMEARKQIMSTLRFASNTQFDWASNQVMKAANVWHSMMDTEDLGFNKLVTRNALGVLQYSRADFEKTVKDTFIKNRRYGFKSNNALNYGANERVWVGTYQSNNRKMPFYTEDESQNGRPVYKTMSVAEYMFGYDVINPLVKDWYDGKIKMSKVDPKTGKLVEGVGYEVGQIEEYYNTDDGRGAIFKNICRAGLAAQVKAHRSYTGTGERWTNGMIRNFVDSLKTLKAYKEDPDHPGEEIIDDPNKMFLSNEDIEWILEQAGCPFWRMFLEDAGMTGVDIGKSIPELVKIFFGGVVDMAA